MNRVAITGFGAVTPLANDAPSSWTRLIEGVSVREPISIFNVSECRCQEGAPVDLSRLDPIPKVYAPSRALHLAHQALKETLKHSRSWNGTKPTSVSPIPFFVSTTGGAMALGESFVRGLHEKRRSDLLRHAAEYQPQIQIAQLQRSFGISGSTWIIGNACASGANAIGHGYDWIRSGRGEIAIVGGYEALTELIYVGFDCLQALSPTGCRPFDLERNGLMLGEGAAFLVLESEKHARDRGVPVHGWVSGYGHSTDTHHLTQPNPKGTALTLAIQEAMRQAKITSDSIGVLNSHGTATPMNDVAEVLSYQSAFGKIRARISSTKAAIGHTLGAAGAIEAVFALQSLRNGIAPPQLHTQKPIPEIAPHLAQAGEKPSSWSHAMSVNLGFGGSNAALVFSRGDT